jgi:hypothetical protein
MLQPIAQALIGNVQAQECKSGEQGEVEHAFSPLPMREPTPYEFEASASSSA